MNRKQTGAARLRRVPCTWFLHGDHEEEREDPLVLPVLPSQHVELVHWLCPRTAQSKLFPGQCFQLLLDHSALLTLMERVPNMHSLTSVETSAVTHSGGSQLSCLHLGAGAHACSSQGEAQALLPHVPWCPYCGAAHRAPR